MKVLTSLLDLLGLAAIATGVVMVSIPAGCVVGGGCALLLSWRLTSSTARAAAELPTSTTLRSGVEMVDVA